MNVLEGQRNEPQRNCNRIILGTPGLLVCFVLGYFQIGKMLLLPRKFNRDANEKEFLRNPDGRNIKPQLLMRLECLSSAVDPP